MVLSFFGVDMYEFDAERVERLDALRKEGIEPYPHDLHVTHSLTEVLSFIGERSKEELAEDETIVTIAGRLMFKNEMGKAGFARIQDERGAIQVYVRKNMIGEEAFESWKKTSLGDHIHVSGRFMRTKTGEATLKASAFVLAAKCITSLPDKHKGLHDIETRSRKRYLDLFINQESREIFRKRSIIVRETRRFFEDRGFLEVETPMLHPIPGGAAARPFVTHHNTLDMDMYMRIAPELYLKRLVVGGLEKVFEVNRNFRNEGMSTQHNPEFTMLEFYQAYATWTDLMILTEDLVRGLARTVCGHAVVEYGEHTLDFETPWKRIPMGNAIADAVGLSYEDVWDPEKLRARWLQEHPQDASNPKLPQTVGKWFEEFFDAYVEPNLIQPTFITEFPVEISPLSRRSDSNPEIAERFELFIAGREIANGFNELNDPVDQANRFSAQVQAKDAGDDEAMFFDSDYIEALSFGMPPTAGEGIGIDRLVMLLTNAASIKEVILFPTLRPKTI
jgi:lysyl-tRNA synthetase class 2